MNVYTFSFIIIAMQLSCSQSDRHAGTNVDGSLQQKEDNKDRSEPGDTKIEFARSFDQYVHLLPELTLPYAVECKPQLEYGVKQEHEIDIPDSLAEATRGLFALVAEMPESYVLLRLEPADIVLPFLIEVDRKGTLLSEFQLLGLGECAFDDDDSLDYNSRFVIRQDLSVERIDYRYDQKTHDLLDSTIYAYHLQ